MALTAEQENKVCRLLDRESEQKRSQILSSAQSFAIWLKVVADIVIAIEKIVDVFHKIYSLFS